MDLFDFFASTVVPLRKGLEVAAISGGIPVVDSYQMYSVDEYANNDEYEVIDVHFICVGINKEVADQYSERFDRMIHGDPFSELISNGTTYIELGQILGSETAALYLMALAKYYGVCDLILPKDLGLYDDEADIAASEGSVVIKEKDDEPNN